MRNEQVDRAVSIEVRRYDNRGRLRIRQRIARWEPSFSVVHAHKAGVTLRRWIAAIRGDNVWITITIQIGERHIARDPMRVAEGSPDSEMTLAVVEINQFPIGRIVA